MTTEQVSYAELFAFAKRNHCGHGSGVLNRCWCPDGDCPCHVIGFQEVHGIVYLFPDESGVRKRCQTCLCEDGHKTCDCCWGLGYTVLDPVQHGDVWAKVLWPLLRAVADQATSRVMRYIAGRVEGDTPAALEAAWDALLWVGIVEETP